MYKSTHFLNWRILRKSKVWNNPWIHKRNLITSISTSSPIIMAKAKNRTNCIEESQSKNLGIAQNLKANLMPPKMHIAPASNFLTLHITQRIAIRNSHTIIHNKMIKKEKSSKLHMGKQGYDHWDQGNGRRLQQEGNKKGSPQKLFIQRSGWKN